MARPITFDPNVGYSDNSRVKVSRSSTWKLKDSRSSAKGRTIECGIAVASCFDVMTNFRDDQWFSKLSSSVRLYNRTGKIVFSEDASVIGWPRVT